jgi:DNA-binding transcriptional LysR family regulator
MIEGEINHPDLELIRWQSDELQAFCAPGHPLAKVGVLTDEDLLATPWILREPGSGTRQTCERGLYDLWSHLNVALELEHTEGIKRAVEAGLGISALSRVVLADAFKRGTLVPLSIAHRDFRREFHFVLHKQKYRSPGIERWLELCRSAVG